MWRTTSASVRCAASAGTGPRTRARATAASTIGTGSCSGKPSPPRTTVASSTSPRASASGRTSQSSSGTTFSGRPTPRASSSCSTRPHNPLTHQAADLLLATTLYRLWQRGHESPTNTDPRKDFEVLAAGLTDDTTVAVFFCGIIMLAVAKPGDEQWTLVDQGNYLVPAISFAGRFYCTTGRAVMVVETTANQPPRLVVAAELARRFSKMMSTVHLVDNDGELMLVYRIAGVEVINEGDDSDDYQERHLVQYKTYRVDLDVRKTKPTHGLGGRAVFIGASHAILVSPLVFPSIGNDSAYRGMDRMLGSLSESTTGPHHFVDGTTMSYREDSCSPEPCDSGEDSVPEYGPGSIDEYLSRYVTGSRDNSEDT